MQCLEFQDIAFFIYGLYYGFESTNFRIRQKKFKLNKHNGNYTKFF